MGRGIRFDIELRKGAGAYICGEETALFNSIEGYRGEPRNKPPFPVDTGLFAKPTVVNNVESLINVLDIVLEGGAAFAGIGTEQSTGTRLFCLSGCVERPGLYEAPFGVTLREVLEMAGGVPRRQRRCKAVLLGGAAGGFVGPDKLDLELSFEATRAAGATLGSGVVMVFDDTVDLVPILLRIAAFFRDESCGQCVPVPGRHRPPAGGAAAPRLRAAARHASPTRSRCSTRSRRRCATRRSAASARRPPTPIESAIRSLRVFEPQGGRDERRPGHHPPHRRARDRRRDRPRPRGRDDPRRLPRAGASTSRRSATARP